MISLIGISKSYDNGVTFAVKDISFTVPKGQILVLLGTSGCGKTTLLKLINRLIEPTAGKILLGGENILDHDPILLRRKIGYVFQGIGLFPHMSISENIAIVPKLIGWPKEKQIKKADELMTLVHLDPQTHGNRLPHELSGGQQQRVGVARALAADPNVLLMDEPFGALDAVTRDSLQEELKHLNKKIGKTIIFVTHDVLEAFTLGDQIAIFHQGSLEQMGTPAQIFMKPATGFVQKLVHKPIERMDSLKTELTGKF